MTKDNVLSDRPLKRGYARIERERRFLVERLPDAIQPDQFERLIDCYISDTNIRLRRVESPDGKLLAIKLGQKIIDPDAPSNPRRRQMTTLYIGEHEGVVFSTLPGRHSTKRRYRFPEQGYTFMIDVYESPKSAVGIMICEVECDTDQELDNIQIPGWCVREITEESKWSAARLSEPNQISNSD